MDFSQDYSYGSDSYGSGGDASGFDGFLSNLEYSLGQGLSAGLNKALGNPTLTQGAPVPSYVVAAPTPGTSIGGMNTNTLLLIGAAVILVLLLK